MGNRLQTAQQARRIRMILDLPDREFSGYIFDCDGTLADTMPLHYRAWARVVAENGGHFPEELFYRWGGRPSAIIVEDLNREFGSCFAMETMVEKKEDYYLELIHEVQPLSTVVDIARGLSVARLPWPWHLEDIANMWKSRWRSSVLKISSM
jgi:beta-phosphoglucomutase-like phosphatase (HAD superfamily)